MPSENLTRLLREMQICRQRDVAACQRSVRRLCRDLPDFDSVWLDALIQRNAITPWQAKQLQSPSPDRLQVEDILLTDQVGVTGFTGRADGEMLFLHRIVSRSTHAGPNLRSACNRILDAAATSDSHSLQTLALPRRLAARESELYFVSENVAGYALNELLVRGGRLPWQVVAEIGRQILNAAAWLESRQLQHGHITLRNIRITPEGRVRLVRPFVFRLLNPHLSFSSELQLKDVESLAPELVSTGASSDSQSELYSIGCVLWQLLTARPVFLPADPVRRMLKARDEDVPDVRLLVPDCPDWMARLIQSLTRRSPELRPSSIKDVWSQWRDQSGKSIAATRRLLKRMPDRKHRTSGASTAVKHSSRAPAISAAAMMTLMFVGYGLQRGLLPLPVSVPGAAEVLSDSSGDTDSVAAVSQPPAQLPDTTARTARGFLTIPKPDAAGVVVLKSGETYEAEHMEYPGSLYIEADSSQSAIVVVPSGESWSVHAAQVNLSGIQVQQLNPSGSSAENADNQPHGKPLVECSSDVIFVRDCALLSDRNACGLQWTGASGLTGVVTLQNTVMTGTGYGLRLSDSADRCELQNCLFVTEGPALRLDVTAGRKLPFFRLNQVTQVTGPAFMDVAVQSQGSETLRIEAECAESVLAPDRVLVRLAGAKNWRANNVELAFRLPERGNPTIIPPDVDPAIHFDRSLNQLVALPESQVLAEALLMATPDFRAASADEQNILKQYELIDYEGPKLNSQLPGADISSLPVIIDSTLQDR